MSTRVDAIVVGGGFWGTALAYRFGELGLASVTLDAGHRQSGSRNAAGIVALDWYLSRASGPLKTMPERWTRQRLIESIEWLERFGLVKTGESFGGTHRPDFRHRKDVWLLPHGALQDANSERFGVQAIRKFGKEWNVGPYRARYVAIAAGVWTDQILANSAIPYRSLVKPLRGRALVTRPHNAERLPAIPVTYQFRPYVQITARPWDDGLCRIGDTVDRTNLAETSMGYCHALAYSVLGSNDPVEILDGLRPVSPRGIVVESPVAGIVIATGGHRVGLGIARIVAREAIELLCG